MIFELTADEKYEVLGLEANGVRNYLSRYALENDIVVSDDELVAAEGLAVKCVDIEWDEKDYSEPTTRASFRTIDGKIVTIRAKKIDFKMLVQLFEDACEFVMNDNLYYKGIILARAMITMFVGVLDDDEALVFEFLARKYFKNGMVFNAENVYIQINQYLNQCDDEWSDKVIGDVIDQLEQKGLVAWQDGVLEVTDSFYIN